MKAETIFMIESFHKIGTSVVLFTDSDLVSSDPSGYKKLLKIFDKKRGQAAVFITTEYDYKAMKDAFGPRKYMTVFK